MKYITYILLFLQFPLFGQNFPVECSITINPPYSVFWSDYTDPNKQLININALLKDLNEPTLNTYLQFEIIGPGIIIRSKPQTRIPIILNGGLSTEIPSSTIAEYLRPANLEFLGTSYSEISRNGQLPEGIYNFSVTIYEFNRSVSISNKAIETAWVVLNDPPSLLYPENGSKVEAQLPQNLIFQWINNHAGTPNGIFPIQYKLEIIEMRLPGINPNEAFNFTTPIYSEIVSSNIHLLQDPLLIPGMDYAFRVQAISQFGGVSTFRNNGFSEVNTFHYGDPCIFEDLSAQMYVSADMLSTTWNELPNHTGYQLSYKTSNSEYSYELKTFSPAAQISGLENNTEYEVMIKSLCGPFESEWSEVFMIKTDESHQDFACQDGNIIAPEYSETIPIFPNDTILANDFKVIVSSIEEDKGEGKLILPFFKRATADVTLNNVEVNKEYELIAGFISIDDFSENIDNINEIRESFEEVLEETEVIAEVIVELKDEIENSTVDSLLVAENPIEENTLDQDVINESGVLANSIEDAISSENSITEESQEMQNIASPANEGFENIGLSGIESFTTKPAIGKSMNFGPLTVNFESVPSLSDSSSTLCSYNNLKASIDLAIDEFHLKKDLALENSLVSFELNCETGATENVSIKWNGNFQIGDIGWLKGEATSLEITVDFEGKINGFIAIKPAVNLSDFQGSLILPNEELSGHIIYNFNGNQNFSGWFDFSGLEDLTTNLVNSGTTLLQNYGVSLDSKGIAYIDYNSPSTIQINASNLTLKFEDLKLLAKLSIWSGPEINEFSSTLQIEGIKGFSSPLSTKITYSQNKWSASSIETNINFYGMAVDALNMDISFDENLQLERISSNFNISHSNFNSSLTVNEFLFIDNSIETLNISGLVEYNGTSIEILSSEYESQTGRIILSAITNIEQGDNKITANIRDAYIDLDGNINFGNFDIDVNLNQQFGPLKIVFNNQLQSSGKDGKYKVYNDLEATLFMELNDREQKLGNVYASFKKNEDSDWVDLNVKAKSKGVSLGKIMGLETKLKTLDISIDNSTNLQMEGKIEADFILTEDKSISSILPTDKLVNGFDIQLVKGFSGSLTYEFGNDSKWMIDELESININLLKNNEIFGSLENGSFREDEITGNLKASEGNSFKVNNFELSILETDLNVSIKSINDNPELHFTSGNATLLLKNIPSIEGEMLINAEFDEYNVLSNVSSQTDLSSFGFEFSDLNLEIDLSRNFELSKISGSLNAKHSKLDAEIFIQEMEIENGVLTKLSSKNNHINYKGFAFELENLEYIDKQLNASAKIELDIQGELNKLEVSDFVINDRGEINIGEISGRLDKSPILTEFNATFSDKSFAGEFSGDFSRYFSMSGQIDIGKKDAFHYGYMAFQSKSKIPLFPGVVLSRLSGNLGFNYQLSYNPDSKQFFGEPRNNSYLIGLGLGISDQAGLVELYGNPLIQFGEEDVELFLTGELNIPAIDPVFKGKLELNYNFGQEILKGKLNTNLQIPPENGMVFNAENIQTDFFYENEKWEIQAPQIQAIIFNKIDFLGSIEANKYQEKFKGTMVGTINYEFHHEIEANIVVGTIKGATEFYFNSFSNLEINNDSLIGSINSNINGTLSLEFSSVIGTVDIASSFDGNLLLEQENTNTKVKGDVTFQLEAMGNAINYEHKIDSEI